MYRWVKVVVNGVIVTALVADLQEIPSRLP